MDFEQVNVSWELTECGTILVSMKIIRQEFLMMGIYAGRYRLLLSKRNGSNTKMKTETSRPRVADHGTSRPWDKVSKNGPRKNCGRHPLKNTHKFFLVHS